MTNMGHSKPTHHSKLHPETPDANTEQTVLKQNSQKNAMKNLFHSDKQ